MSIAGIILLILLGIVLILLEILVVPGITIAGIGGIALMIAAVYMAYQIDANYGVYVITGNIVLLLVAIIFALRAKTWNRISLNTKISGKVETVKKEEIKKGDIGITVSRLAPMGKVFINDKYYEAKTRGIFIDPQQNIRVIKVNGNQLLVEEYKETKDQET